MFKQNRLYSVVIAENIPQLIIQVVYAMTVEGGIANIGAVSIAVILSSLLSISAAIFEFISKGHLLDEDIIRCEWSTKVSSTDQRFITKRTRFVHKTKCL